MTRDQPAEALGLTLAAVPPALAVTHEVAGSLVPHTAVLALAGLGRQAMSVVGAIRTHTLVAWLAGHLDTLASSTGMLLTHCTQHAYSA